MRYLTLAEVLELHRRLIQQSGGSPGLRDLGSLESALAQLPRPDLLNWIRRHMIPFSP